MKTRWRVPIALVLLAAGLVGTAVPGASDENRTQLRIHAAASLTDIVESLVPLFDRAQLETSFGASSVLARQIADGAPADVFLSASPDWVRYLQERNAVAGEPVVFARNELVCITPRGGRLAELAPGDVRALLDALGEDGRVAIADAGVPAGEYARAALSHLGLMKAAEPLLVGQKDVRAVLHAVERGELDAGFVYSTDAKVADVDVLFRFPASSHPPIEYVAAVLRSAAHKAQAADFVKYLQSGRARDILSHAGFALP